MTPNFDLTSRPRVALNSPSETWQDIPEGLPGYTLFFLELGPLAPAQDKAHGLIHTPLPAQPADASSWGMINNAESQGGREETEGGREGKRREGKLCPQRLRILKPAR